MEGTRPLYRRSTEGGWEEEKSEKERERREKEARGKRRRGHHGEGKETRGIAALTALQDPIKHLLRPIAHQKLPRPLLPCFPLAHHEIGLYELHHRESLVLV